MIHITKNFDGEFYVINIAANGEPLASSESFIKKQNAYKNIIAQRLNFTQDSPGSIPIQDDTGKKPKVVLLTKDGKLLKTKYKPEPVYTPHRRMLVQIPRHVK